jgi:hypothetical protein
LRRRLVAGFLIVFLLLGTLTYVVPVFGQKEGSEWEMYRPSLPPNESLPIEERVQNANTSDEASVGIGVYIMDYVENWSWAPYYNRDGVHFRVAATANTRKGITYDCFGPSSILPDEWIDATEPVKPGGLADNSGTWLNISFPICFYGGLGYVPSFYYDKVWVCDNGFVSFDNESTSPNPTQIPDPEKPNALVAVHWVDLDPTVDGASIAYKDDSINGRFVKPNLKVMGIEEKRR